MGNKIADTAARAPITVGGIGTIVAVVARVCLYLLSVVIPLFTDGELDERASADPAVVMDSPINDVVAIGTDQHMGMAVGVRAWR